jgi:sugar/nucleoside kinase (ribokinase family)
VHLLRRLRRAGVTTSWDVGWHPEAMRDENFHRVFAELSIVFLNEMEALRYSRSRSRAVALDRLARPGQVLVIKLGRRGAIGVDRDGRRFRAPAVAIRAVETTGAGDAFNAGFLHRWLDGTALPECLRAGNICGALSTRVPGGSGGTPYAAELARWSKTQRRQH